MDPAGKQIRAAVTYIVFLGHAGARRPAWAIVAWWLLAVAVLVFAYAQMQGMRWGWLWVAALALQWVVLSVWGSDATET